ncbi:hypothetical protein GALMADRAFT_241303 [Galerina marginata CBS 339.88]|uniref:Uncharacterized protein n=1 Tax=Galerina marginata (strain CBS 339.88) TaxID=685588 RepID=A0A067TPE2_GALM3|nr:hypothetical protein GALMADRAFT_241303 [Galerina marginata CBS 339.88]
MPKTQTSAASKARKKPAWIPKKLGGEYPQLTSLNKTLQDPRTGKFYIYGGLAPGDTRNLPKPDFYVCDTKDMKFTDLTDSLTYTPRSVLGSELRVKKRLPALLGAGISLMEVGSCSLIFLFGGHNADEDNKPSSTLIAIDPERKEWWIVEFEDEFPSPVPRINPVLVAANQKLYIFGGIKQFEANWAHHKTYSIVDVELPLAGPNRWKWAALDIPYPRIVKNQIFGYALSVHDGMMILLLPGRKTRKAKLDFQFKTMFYFLPSSNNFFLMGKPKGYKALSDCVHWYGARNFDPLSVLLCAWIPHSRGYLVPELWQYSIFPDNKVVCLGVGQKVFDLDIDLRHFTVVGDKMFLMGQTNEDNKDDYPGTMCDTYVEVSMASLL